MALRGLIVVVLLMGLAWLIIYLNRRATLYNAFEDLAKRYLGRVSRSLLGNPRLTFFYREQPVRMSTRMRLPQHGGRQTRFQTNWNDRRFQLILRQHAALATSPPRGLDRYSFEQPALNERFEVWTNDLEHCRQVLSPACVWHIVQLADMAKHRYFVWQIRRGTFQIGLGGHFRKKQQLCDVAAQMLDLYSQAQLAQTQGLEFSDDQAAQVIEQMVCPICSGVISNDVVICARCRTPHCKECWIYNGKCATFACGADKFISLNATEISKTGRS